MRINIRLFGGRGSSSRNGSFYLPKNPSKYRTFNDITNPKKREYTQYREYKDLRNGNIYEFHPGRTGENGWRGKDHYHWRNPNRTNNKDYYFDQHGQPTPKGSNNSHLKPGFYKK